MAGSVSRRVRLAAYIFLCFSTFLPLTNDPAGDSAICGDLFDTKALRTIKTVYLDTTNLDAPTASDLKAFVAREKEPGQLLSRLSWRFTDQSTTADAVLRVYFAAEERRTMTNAYAGQPARDHYESVIQAVLLVYDRASVRLLYRAANEGVGKRRAAQLKGPFAKLVKSVQSSRD